MVLTFSPPPFSLEAPAWLRRWMELRIDVERPSQPMEDALDSIYDRLHQAGDRLHGIPAVPLNDPDLVVRYREADGEFYVYVEDVRRQCLAGYTVFNRLIEVDRKADRHVRAPHSSYAEAYQGRGLASAIYRWGLDAGLCLISGARQSPGAHALWRSLAREHELGCVRLQDKTLTYLGREVSPDVMNDLHTRMLLLGKGWTLERFAGATGMHGMV